MAEVFSGAFAAEQHVQWAASQFAWDPSQLHLLPRRSPGSVSDGAASEQASEGLGSCSGAQRDQSLGPLPVGWQETTRAGAGGKEAKGNHARAPKGPLVCQVESCGHDLSLEKGYYQRYRVCEPHMKLMSLVVNGKACRFCQQCGRFQELTEFDGSKRSCRARLLQHNARRRKRDPLDTSRKEQPNSRKSKSTHPWSDSSNDADVASGDIGHGVVVTDKSLNHSLDSGVDQNGKARMAFGYVPQVSNGGPPILAAGLSGMAAPDMIDATTSGSTLQNPLGPLQSFPLSDQQQQQPMPLQQSINADFARCFSGAPDLGSSLDEMLDGILGSSNDYLDDPRTVGLLPQGEVRGSFTGPSMAPMSGSGLGASGALPFVDGGQSTAQFDAMVISSQRLSGPLLGQGVTAVGSGLGVGGGYTVSSLPNVATAWQSGGLAAETGPTSANDLAVALNKRAIQQRQLQEMQMQQQRQQQQQLLLQQQQPLGGPVGRAGAISGGSSMMQVDYMNSQTSVVSGGACGYDGGVGGSMGMGNGALSGQLGGIHSVNRNTMSPAWGGMNSTGAPLSNGPPMLSGGMSLHPNVSHGPMGLGLGAGPASVAAPPSASVLSSFELARSLVAAGGAAARYESEDLLVRVSIKIANCTPEQLPSDLYQRLRNLLNTADASLIQGFLRPGCTHLVLDVQAGKGGPDCFNDGLGETPGLAVSAADLRAVLGSVACRSPVLIQTEDQVALWHAGAALSAKPHATAAVSDLLASGSLPSIEHVSAAAHVNAEDRTVLVVYGTGLAGEGVSLFARMQGGYLPVSALPLVVDGKAVAVAADAAAAAAAIRCMEALQRAGRKATDAMLVTVECAPGSGLLFVEAQTGPLLSNCRPCLLLTDAEMVTELSRMEGRAIRAGESALVSLQSFTTDLGLVLDRRSYFIPLPPGRLASVASDGEDETAEAADGVYTPPPEDVAASQADSGDVTLALVCVCERLLAWAADSGTARVASFLAAALRQHGQDMQAILEAPYADGLAVVHRCMRSGNPEMVRALMHWAASSRVQLAWGSAGALGLSPLHLAALVPTTWRLLAATPVTRAGWESAGAAAGAATPAQLQRMLVARLPRGVLPAEVLHAFAPPQRAVASQAAVPAQLVVAAETAVVSARAAPAEAPQGRRQRGLPSVVGIASTLMVFSMAAVLFALQPAAGRAGGAEAGARAVRQTLLHRVAPEYEGLIVHVCTSMLYLGLLGMAACLLPVSKTMLTGVHPASTCLGA